MSYENPVDVLLVEDDINDASLAKRILQKSRDAKYFVAHVSDGVEATEYLSGHLSEPERPRLVLLDLKIPKLDGFAVLERMRSIPEWSRVPVVVLSSSSIETDIVEGLLHLLPLGSGEPNRQSSRVRSDA